MTVVRRYSVQTDSFDNSYPTHTWIDDESFLIYTSTQVGNLLEMTAWRGTVDGEELLPESVPTYSDTEIRINGVGSGHGAIALITQDQSVATCSTVECPKFKVWADDGTVSDELDGWPTAWSVDGSRLAVVLSPPLGGIPEPKNILAAGNYYDAGPLEILSYPGLNVVYKNMDVSAADVDMRFSPTGRFLAGDIGDGQLLDLQTFKLTKAPSESTSWFGDDSLLAPDGRDVIAQSIDGAVVQRWRNAGGGPLDSSPDGQLAALSDSRSAPTAMTVLQDGDMSRYPLADLPLMNGVNLVMPTPANDGRSIALTTETPDRFGPLLVLQTPN